MHRKFVVWFEEVTKKDTAWVGGKNASLGEMIQKTGVPIPPGFAITADAYWHFVKTTGAFEKIKEIIRGLNVKDIADLKKRGRLIRECIKKVKLPEDLKQEIIKYYHELGQRLGIKDPLVAVRSSATAEDLKSASFAGQQETYLNVKGERQLLDSVRKCMASLFTDRAISYREDKGFDHLTIALSVGIQAMITADAAGVVFTIDPDSGFEKIICIEAGWGLGEGTVKGILTPDVFHVFKPTLGIVLKRLGDKRRKVVRGKGPTGTSIKPTTKEERENFCLSDEEVKELARYCIQIEKHYAYPQDIEWVKDKHTGKIFIVQSRPETVHALKVKKEIEEYVLKEKGKLLVTGQAIGRKIGVGEANVIKDVKDIGKFRERQVLVTEMTDPDWEPIMKIAAGIVTDRGGHTSHAAIVSRELGIPCIVGTEKGTQVISTDQPITVDCTQETGRVWSGELEYEVRKVDVAKIPKTKTKIYVNIGVPEKAYTIGQLPVDGVGLARIEFIIASHIAEHPLAMIEAGRAQEYVDKLAEGIAKFAAAFYPRPVVVRFSDFKTNEYASLKGGKRYEPTEANPMLGWRGAARYTDPVFEPAFRLECRAIRKVRDEMGLTNVIPMIPFCRTVKEAERTLQIMAEEGLKRGVKGLSVWVMAEVPSNIMLADQFSELFDGHSIGSNDLTQLCLGIDRDSAKLATTFDERNPAVLRMLEHLIKTAHAHGTICSICGEAPSYYKDFTRFLIKCGIDSISVNPEVAIETRLLVHKVEKELLIKR